MVDALPETHGKGIRCLSDTQVSIVGRPVDTPAMCLFRAFDTVSWMIAWRCLGNTQLANARPTHSIQQSTTIIDETVTKPPHQTKHHSQETHRRSPAVVRFPFVAGARTAAPMDENPSTDRRLPLGFSILER